MRRWCRNKGLCLALESLAGTQYEISSCCRQKRLKRINKERNKFCNLPDVHVHKSHRIAVAADDRLLKQRRFPVYLNQFPLPSDRAGIIAQFRSAALAHMR
jgi:hypothetical protein